MTSQSPFTATSFSDSSLPPLPPLAGGEPSEDTFDSFSFFPTSSSFTINPNGLFPPQQPVWEDQKWTDQQSWGLSFPSSISPFDFSYDLNPHPPSTLSSGCTSPTSSSRSNSFDAFVPPGSTSPFFPFNDDSVFKPNHLQPQPSTVVSTSSRGRKLVAPASFAEDLDSGDASSSSKIKMRSKGKRKIEEDEEDEGSDFEGFEDGGGSRAGKGGKRGGKSAMEKKERRKATNRASAKAFRARRKNLLNDIQAQISERDTEIQELHFLITRLKEETQTILAAQRG